MVEFVMWCLPAVIYVLVQSRRPESSVRDALDRVGATWGVPSAYGWAAVLVVVLVALAWAATLLIPIQIIRQPGVSIAEVGSVIGVVLVVLKAVGEEVFFRGLLGGILARRLGPVWGNLVQALIFMLPHLVLLTVGLGMWPILVVQFMAGLATGWLRNRSGSFVPGAVVHVLMNIAAGLGLGLG